MVDILIDGDGNSVLDLPDDELDDSVDAYGELAEDSTEPEPEQRQRRRPRLQQRQQQGPAQQQTIPLPLIPLDANAEAYKKLSAEGFDFTPGGLFALQELIDLPYPASCLLAEGLDEAILTLAEGFFGDKPYVGIRTFVDNDDEIREIVALDFLTVFEEQGHESDVAFNEKDVRDLVPLLLLLTGRAMHEETLPPATHLIMEDFWKELDLRPDASTADLDRVSTWFYQSRIPPESVLKGLRKVLNHYLRPGRLPH